MTVDLRFQSSLVEVPDSLEEANEFLLSRRMTDGLPIIPPTPERVERMLKGTRRGLREVVGRVPPLWGPATVEKIAINAVMAGCVPEYMPALIAAVEAVCDEPFNLHGIQTTTNSVGPMLVFNGPIRQQLNINCGAGVLGPGWRANATLGRAIRLIMLNVGGATPGDVDKSTQGWPGKYTCCIGENEEASPWEPLHVERGFRKDDSTVTVFGVDGSTQSTDISPWPEQVIRQIAFGMVRLQIGRGSEPLNKQEEREPIILLNPVFAGMFAEKLGHTKESLKRYLWETARFPADWVPASHAWVIPENGRVRLMESPAGFHVIVTGGDSGYHSTAMTTVMSKSVTKRIGG